MKNDCLKCALVIHGTYGNYCGSSAWESYTTGRPIRNLSKTPRWCPGMVTEAEQAEFEKTLVANSPTI